ncbi:PilZ domain-containing protein [Qipengyuania aquimaris]|uniref:PilZ domain-containing protein n=1 Tax=Qipengyuania aquimaris TaxID=255984 RepID=UPI001C96E195|nr:PilZ domain-containing protein [Qipengyuania aquimaris]MBY6127451.1 PilZ domain-containing protein [Qipengyuania aquimaris]
MDYSATLNADSTSDQDPVEQRGAPRYASLIRAAKLVCGQGEFICVIRDVSATGVSLRTFHALPQEQQIALELQNGETYDIEEVRREGFEASYRFKDEIEVEKLIQETWNFPKRQLRLNIALPLKISSLSGSGDATTVNLSQQGARVECDAAFAIDQTLKVTGSAFPDTRAKVRWRRDSHYGLVFDNTLSLRQFALLAASVQCPSMLDDMPA